MISILYGYKDLTGGTFSTPYPFMVVSTASTNSFGPFIISFKEHMRRLRQSLEELRLGPPEPLRAVVRPRMARQGRHGFQMAYRRPGYRAKRPR